MQTRIIAAFPGTGKSWYHNNHKDTTLDSDSSQYSWINDNGTKLRNKQFPGNYIEHIRQNIGKYEIILVSTHKEVREALLNNCLFFYLIYPQQEWKQKFITRYQQRGSDHNFIRLLETNWDKWIKECDFCERGCKRIQMSFDYIGQEIEHIIASEGGDVV